MGEHATFVILSLLAAVLVLAGLFADTLRLRARARRMLEMVGPTDKPAPKPILKVTKTEDPAAEKS